MRHPRRPSSLRAALAGVAVLWGLPSAAQDGGETTKIEPSLVYRYAILAPVERSVYHKPEHRDGADQIYATFRLVRTYAYTHEVVIEPSLRTYRNNPGTWESPVMEQAYWQAAVTDAVQITAGKKTEYEGSGLLVNPSDLLNEEKDLFDPLYQREGRVFGRVSYRTGEHSLGVAFVPAPGGAASEEGRVWLTAGTELYETELRLSAMHHETEKTTLGVSASRFFGGSVELHADARHQSRQRSRTAAGNRHMAYSSYTEEDASAFYLVGSRLVFSPRRTLAVESITNQSGLLPHQLAAYHEALREETAASSRVREPPTKILGRHYAFASYQDDDTLPGVHMAASVLANTDDRSGFATVVVRRHLSPITAVELVPTAFFGRRDTEFGEMPFARTLHLVFRGRF